MGELKLVDIICRARGAERAPGDGARLPLQVRLWTRRDDVSLERLGSAGVPWRGAALRAPASFHVRVCLWIPVYVCHQPNRALKPGLAEECGVPPEPRVQPCVQRRALRAVPALETPATLWNTQEELVPGVPATELTQSACCPRCGRCEMHRGKYSVVAVFGHGVLSVEASSISEVHTTEHRLLLKACPAPVDPSLGTGEGRAVGS